MVFLHWPIFTDLDWKNIVDASQVVVLIPSTVFYEIDNHKDRNSAQSIRKRARKVLLEIETRLGASEMTSLGNDVSLHLDLNSYSDFEAYGLSSSVKDDDILLAALKWREAEKEEVVIVSGDSTMRTKARRRGFDVYTPPEATRIEDPLDDYQRTIADLNQQLLSVRSKEPKLKIKHQNGEAVLTFQPESISTEQEAYVSERLSVFRKLYSPIKTSQYPTDYRPSDERHAYNQNLEKFYVDLEMAFRNGFKNMLLRTRGFWTDLEIANIGGGPASHIRIQLTAPEGVRLYDERNAPTAPELPSAPEKPVAPGSIYIPRSSRMARGTPRPSLEWDVDNHTIATREITSVIQHAPQPLSGLFVLPIDSENNRGFHLDVRITCAELAEPVTQQLHFRYIAPDFSHIDDKASFDFLENLSLFHRTELEEYEAFRKMDH